MTLSALQSPCRLILAASVGLGIFLILVISVILFSIL
jgi:hypothetical protein